MTKLNKAWAGLQRKTQLRAYRETGSFVESRKTELSKIGGSTQDVLEDWVKDYKKKQRR